jgi:hypothetical protein
MFFNISIEHQSKRILKGVNLNKKRSVSGVTCDITDGQIYKNFMKEENKKNFKNSLIYSFKISTDGVALCEKSKLGIWPIYLVINEIPKEQRFFVENVVFAGIFKSCLKFLSLSFLFN